MFVLESILLVGAPRHLKGLFGFLGKFVLFAGSTSSLGLLIKQMRGTQNRRIAKVEKYKTRGQQNQNTRERWARAEGH